MAANFHPGFWFGLLLFYAGLVVFIVGFSCPFWFESNYANVTGKVDKYFGLWYGCVRYTPTSGGEKLDCSYVTDNTTIEYMKAVEALQVIALIGFAVTIVLKFTVMCFAEFRRSYRRSIEFTLLGSVVSGLLGVAVYGGACRYIETSLTVSTKPMSWAFGINLAGLVALLLAAFVLAAFNRTSGKPDQDKPFREYSNRAYDDDRYLRYGDYQYEYGRQQQAGIPMAVWARKGAPEYVIPATVRAPYLVPYGPPIPTRGHLY